ncbi:MAG: twin-arginine translocase subunit TatC [Candidatus Eiseniibacteriota bacterium]
MSGSGDQKEMSFLEHLEELRGVIILSLVALAVAFAAGWPLSAPVLDLLIEHTVPDGVPVVFLSPAEAFTSRLKVALTVALIVALPFISWRIWRFIVPGLLESERRAFLPLTIASTCLFYAGVAFALVTLVPIVIAILLAFGTGSLTPTIAIGALLGFVLKLCLACGLVFQMPLLIAVLTHLGIVTPEWLVNRWRYAVLIIFLASAVLTPADAASQLVLGLPVTGLYFVSIAVSRVVARRRRERRAREAAELDEDDRDADGGDDDDGGGGGGDGGGDEGGGGGGGGDDDDGGGGDDDGGGGAGSGAGSGTAGAVDAEEDTHAGGGAGSASAAPPPTPRRPASTVHRLADGLAAPDDRVPDASPAPRSGPLRDPPGGGEEHRA